MVILMVMVIVMVILMVMMIVMVILMVMVMVSFFLKEMLYCLSLSFTPFTIIWDFNSMHTFPALIAKKNLNQPKRLHLDLKFREELIIFETNPLYPLI